MTTTTPNELAVEVMAVELLRPDPHNPRDTLGELSELTDSIESIGVLQPLIVTPTGEVGADDAEIMMVVAGHRRLAAAMLAERTHVPVIVRVDITEEGRRAAQFIENFHRLDLGPIERARALRQLADTGMHQKDIGAKVGINQGTVSKWLALLKLPEKAQKWVAEGTMSQEDGVALAALPEEQIAELTALRPPGEWQIRKAKDDVANAKKREAAAKKATAAGWTILEEDPDLGPQQLELGESPDGPVALDTDRDDPYGLLAYVDPEDHASEPCHAVFVAWNGDLHPACTDSARHPKPEGWKSPHDLAQAEAARTGLAPAGNGRQRKLSQWEIDRAKRDVAKVAIGEIVEPIRALGKAVLEARPTDVGAVVDFGVLAVLLGANNPTDASAICELLGLATSGWSWERLIGAITAEGPGVERIDGLRVLYAWGLAQGLAAIVEVGLDAATGTDLDDEDDAVVAAHSLLAHLGQFGVVPTFDAFVASCSPLPAAPAGDGPTVEVYEAHGKFKRRCSECGELDGVNTKQELADDRAAAHLSDAHGIELAEAGVA